MIRYSLFIALFLILQACGGQEKVELKTEKEKYSYVLGVEIAKPFVSEAPFNKMDKEKLIEGFHLKVKDSDFEGLSKTVTKCIGKTGKEFNEKYNTEGSLAVGKINRLRFEGYFNDLDAMNLIDIKMVERGFSDGLNKLDIEVLKNLDRKKIMASFEVEMNKKYTKITEQFKAAGEQFLAMNKTKAGIITTASGLQYEIIKTGKGEKPKATSSVKVHYQGSVPEGGIFDGSIGREPVTFVLNQVIPGWTEGIQLMNPGSKFKFYIPQELAYGGNPPPNTIIKPYSPLIFEVELISIEKDAAPDLGINPQGIR
ncbi:MAG: FKBP-type peptidyl-prolyl cis-trans isomerase [Crocinitomicaceae bacterium]|jgi:FKBP-type peptidyl-prolyl cis-trans isomerase